MSRMRPLIGRCRLVPHQVLGWAWGYHIRAGTRHRRAHAWLVEPLEGRIVPATILVTSVADAGVGTLRAAIQQANLDAAGDTITFAPSVTGAITLLTALPDLTANMRIVGPGPSSLTVARSPAAGTPVFSVLTMDDGAEVGLTGLAIKGGMVNNGSVGGGIDNMGTLTLTDCTVSGNLAGEGGGIGNSGSLTLTDSIVSGNSTVGSETIGGGIFNTGTLTGLDSTITDNSSSGLYGYGGGIYSGGTGTLTLTDCAVSGNLSDSNTAQGVGILNLGTAMIAGCTVSNNSANVLFPNGAPTAIAPVY